MQPLGHHGQLPAIVGGVAHHDQPGRPNEQSGRGDHLGRWSELAGHQHVVGLGHPSTEALDPVTHDLDPRRQAQPTDEPTELIGALLARVQQGQPKIGPIDGDDQTRQAPA